jgi:thioester reductase-like protein
MSDQDYPQDANDVAIIAITGRFPGAASVDAFWQNLRDGIEAVLHYSDAELLEAGVERSMLDHPSYVKAGTVLDDIDLFDAPFFSINPREAELMDPQQRLFLECAWEVLERAGYDPATYTGRIGVFGGTFMSRYAFNLYSTPGLVEMVGETAIRWGNDKDYLAPRVSYKLNLKGPSININTSCSTSLVAVHIACQSLLNGECDMALAGGVSLNSAEKAGYIYQEGDIVSPDGHCRAFDAQAQGTVFGSGLGIVVLKRMADALADGDQIYAIIKGSAVNNDGADKIGFSAPSVAGQTEVIAEALSMANIAPETINYIETHGTGTPLGDPIEIEALTNVFRASTQQSGFCAIGSVKTNVGHLGTAAGVTGLIKTVMALNQRMIPASLHFRSPNPNINFAESPFYVSTGLSEWARGDTPRRAGVSSFGIGGTNAHVVLEEAPLPAGADSSRPWQLLLLSARTSAALEQATTNLVAHLKAHPDQPIADVAYTLQVGRRAFSQRRMLVCRSHDDALAALEPLDPQRALGHAHDATEPRVVFMFSGQGAQYVNMAHDLYATEPTFRAQIDRCCELLVPQLGRDLREIMFPRDERRTTNDEGTDSSVVARPSSDLDSALDQTQYAQPALFVIEYALAQLWMSWGVQPDALIGHSIGEYVAACLAGVFSLEDALTLVAARGRAVQQLPPGAMLVVMLPEQAAHALLGEQLALAAVNGPAACVISGPFDAVRQLEQRLDADEISYRRLHVSHAFHSSMMDPILAAFTEQVARVKLSPPRMAYLSNVSGSWITAAEATSPRYWARHLRQTVRWADGLQTLMQEPNRVFLEVGPGQTLSTLARQAEKADAALILGSLRHPRTERSDVEIILNTLGRLWLAGVMIDWAAFYGPERRRRVVLPTYPFARQRYWIGRPPNRSDAPPAPPAPQNLPQPVAEPAVAIPAAHARPDMPTTYAEPRTETERGVAELYQQLLGISAVGIYDDFFELGGHSLLLTQLMTRLRNRFQMYVPLNNLFHSLTIASIAEEIDRMRREGIVLVPPQTIDLWAEAALDPSIPAATRSSAPVAEARQILLTGATGFVGAFLLNELLRQTQAQIVCLVRAQDAGEGQQRIREALTFYRLCDADVSDRVIAIVGDLAQPLLGLTNEQFQALADTIDVIYHNGALVNFISPYQALKATNVLGTQDIIRLASQGKPKSIHFVSSTGALADDPNRDVIFHENDVSRPEYMYSGYNQSKWVSEQLIRSAGRRGIDVTIYRPGNITGHSQTGACNTNDFVFRTVKGWVQLGIAPDSAGVLDIEPVDYVCAALVHLSLQPASIGKTFHLTNPTAAGARQIVDWMRAFGYQLELIGPQQWPTELARRLENSTDNALYPLLSIITPTATATAADPDADLPTYTVQYDCRHALDGLKDSAISCPPVDDALLDTYFTYLIRSEFLQAP